MYCHTEITRRVGVGNSTGYLQPLIEHKSAETIHSNTAVTIDAHRRDMIKTSFDEYLRDNHLDMESFKSIMYMWCNCSICLIIRWNWQNNHKSPKGAHDVSRYLSVRNNNNLLHARTTQANRLSLMISQGDTTGWPWLTYYYHHASSKLKTCASVSWEGGYGWFVLGNI